MTKRKPVLIQGRGPRRPTPPIIFKTKLVPEGPTKIFLETGPPLIYPPPPPQPHPYRRVWIQHWKPIAISRPALKLLNITLIASVPVYKQLTARLDSTGKNIPKRNIHCLGVSTFPQ